MYERYYGFKVKPFALIPQEEFMFLSRQHRMALELLVYGLRNHALFCVVCGDVGTGKTTLVRYLIKRLGSRVTVGVITGMHGTFMELLQWILFAFGVEYQGLDKIGMQQALVQYFRRQEGRSRRITLIIDEAQALAPEVLEELRLFSNVNFGQTVLLQTVLVGQLALRDTLRRPEMRQFAQRVAVDYVLFPLDREQTLAYIRHRLAIANPAREKIFTPEACEAVFTASHGIPRIINLLCDAALVYGYADQRDTIDLATVKEMLEDKAQDGGWLFDAG